MADKPNYITLAHLRTAISALLNKIDTKPDEEDFANVAFSGDYSDLTNRPDLSAYVNWTTYSELAGYASSVASVNGILKGNGNGSITAATAGTDYQAPLPSTTGNNGKFLSIDNGNLAWSSLGSIFTYKGTKTDTASLPSSGNTTGDVWIVTADNSEHVWNGSAWEELGPTIDLSIYMRKGVDYVTAGQKSGTTLGTKATAEGNATTASGDYSHAEGNNTKATNTNAHAEGYSTTASGLYSHAEGVQTTASGDRSHAEGNNSIASGSSSHAEGVTTLATSDNAHAEGQCTTASNSSAHSEGSHSIASGQQAHAEGKYTNAFGGQSHAEGEGIKYDVVLTASGTEKSYNVTTSNVYIPNNIPTSGWRLFDPVYAKKWYTVQGTTLDGRNLTRISLTEELSSAVTQNGSTCYLVLTGAHYGYSHTEGQGSISGSIAQHVGGKFNEVVVGAEVIGGGSDNANRENIRVLDWSGNETLAGKLTVGAGPTNNMDVATKQYVDNSIVSGNFMVKGVDYVTAGQLSGSTLGTHATTEGTDVTASGTAAHAEGYETTVTANYGHAEGYKTTSEREASHAEGHQTFALGDGSHSEGQYTIDFASGHAEGNGGINGSSGGHVEGIQSLVGSVYLTGPTTDGGTTYTVNSYDSIPSYLLLDSSNLSYVSAVFIVDPETGEYSSRHDVINCSVSNNNLTSLTFSETLGSLTNELMALNIPNTLGNGAHAEGNATKAYGNGAHAEGNINIATGNGAHVEGQGNQALNNYTHAEGTNTTAKGEVSHAEGTNTTASGDYSHAEGQNSYAIDTGSHAEGKGTITTGTFSHAEGCNLYYNINLTGAANAETYNVTDCTVPTEIISALRTTAPSIYGIITTSNNGTQLAKITNVNISNSTLQSITIDKTLSTSSITNTQYRIIIPNTISMAAHSEGFMTFAGGQQSHSEGGDTIATGESSHAEGNDTKALGSSSHSENNGTIASGNYSHAEGSNTISSGSATHSEGSFTIASNDAGHSEGIYTIASGPFSHSEGQYRIAEGTDAHAEGIGTLINLTLSGPANVTTYTNTNITYTIPENITTASDLYIRTSLGPLVKVTNWTLTVDRIINTITTEETLSSLAVTNQQYVLILPGAQHNHSHVEGNGTITYDNNQHVGGKYNLLVTGAEVIGGGTDNNNRTNIRTLDWSGNETLAGKLTLGAGPVNNMDATTKQYVDTAIGNAASITMIDHSTNTTTELNNLTINKLSQAQYNAISTPDPNQLYMITDDTIYAEKSYVDNLIPSQSGNSGKVLTTNGTTASWATINALPSQSGNSGKFLTTNGTTASWTTKPSYTYSEVGAAASSHNHAASDITSGTLAIARGGTNATTAAAARANLGTLGSKSANGYEGMTDMAGADNVWIRTTSQGIIPYQSGGSTAGHSYLGTSSWYFYQAYIQTIYSNQTFGAVWNDYAEYRQAETTDPGRCVKESPTGIMELTTKRMEKGCEIISDTFGFAIGEDEKCKTPIAATGRVLAYTDRPREEFELGMPVCSGPNGTVSQMTEEEARQYPWCIIGTVSEIPTYEEWGTGNVKVNNRIWIRIR